MQTTETATRRPMLEPYKGVRILAAEIGERAWGALNNETYHSNEATDELMARPFWCWLHDTGISDGIDRKAEAMAKAEEAERRIGMRWAAAALHHAWYSPNPDARWAVEQAWTALLDGDLRPLGVTS